MDNMEEKLGAILNDPNIMQQIMSMAQALNISNPPQREASQPKPPVTAPANVPDPAMLQSIASIARRSSLDQDQQSLLKALIPYVSQQRIQKLEKALRAAKIAGIATTFLRSGVTLSNTGR